MPSNNYIIIEGGGANGLFALGALKWLFEKGINPSIIMGTSIGGVIALGLACTKQHKLKWAEANELLIEKFDTLSWSDLVGSFDWRFWSRGGLFKNNIENVFKEIIGDDKIPNLITKVGVAVCDIDNEVDQAIRIEGNFSGIPKNYKASQLAAMTANIPGLFSYYPDPISGHRIYDGGVACNDTIAYLCEHLAEEKIEEANIHIIRLASWKPTESWLYGPVNNLYELFALSRAKCEELSIKISLLYRKLKPKYKMFIYDFKDDIGTLAFKAGENRKMVDEAYKKMS